MIKTINMYVSFARESVGRLGTIKESLEVTIQRQIRTADDREGLAILHERVARNVEVARNRKLRVAEKQQRDHREQSLPHGSKEMPCGCHLSPKFPSKFQPPSTNYV